MFTFLSHKTLAAIEVATALVLGITLTAAGSLGSLSADLTGGGALLGSADGLHSAPFAPQYAAASAAWQLTLGLLLILLGFFLHACMVVKDEKPVRVKAAKKKSKYSRAGYRWYWMEMKI